ncbi:MAG TPA: PLP-dependent aminotransferase family protein [Capillimicrobium sp.]|nr:PLP-dependent aminotransferase family protein [Capillimicrobium sp.]
MPEDNASAVLAELRSAAEAGPAGARLPSVRELARRHRASPVTVQRALATLAAEGLVEPRPGRGTFVAPPRPAPAAEPDLDWQALALGDAAVDAGGLDALLSLPGPGAIALSSGFPDEALQPRGALAAAAARAARRPGAWGRIPLEGSETLRTWFAREAGGRLRAHDLVICSGGQAALGTVLRALARPGDALVVESPTYNGALAAARTAGLRIVPVPSDADGVRPELLEEALRRSGARLAFLQPTFANPHGATLSPARRAEVLAVAEAAGAFLVEDDWARDLALDGDAPPPLAAADEHGHVVYVRSLTKSAAPGLRVAALGARGPAAARLRAARVVDDFFVSGVLQETALELVSAPAWPRHLRALRAALRERRDALAAAVREHLPQARLAPIPRGGQHLWAQLPDGVDDLALVRRAAAAGVVIHPGRMWFPADPPGTFVRLSYGGAPAADLVEGVRRLAQTMAG